MVSSSHNRLSGLDPAAPLKLSQTSFVAKVPVSNSPARPTTGPEGAGLAPVGGLELHSGGRVEETVHCPLPSQVRPEPQVPQLPPQPSGPQTFPEHAGVHTVPTLNARVSWLLVSLLSLGIRLTSSTNPTTW